jgi:translation initiation factor 2B subunit (eIF-2B alpha/beta/delta family)
MDITLIQQLFTQGGISAVVLYIAYKAITKLYADMREDSQAREKALMEHLDKVTDTLDRIDDSMSSMNNRLECVERFCQNADKKPEVKPDGN